MSTSPHKTYPIVLIHENSVESIIGCVDLAGFDIRTTCAHQCSNILNFAKTFQPDQLSKNVSGSEHWMHHVPHVSSPPQAI